MTATPSILRPPRPWILLGVTIAVTITLLVATGAFGAGGIFLRKPGSGAPAPSVVTVGTAGSVWILTPPATWCSSTRLAGGGIEYTCGDPGVGAVLLNVTHPSRLVGEMNVSGPSTVWLYPAYDGCDWGSVQSGVPHSCAPPAISSPAWKWWSANLTGGPVNLSALPLNITSAAGKLPPALWILAFVDPEATNETLTALTPITLHSP